MIGRKCRVNDRVIKHSHTHTFAYPQGGYFRTFFNAVSFSSFNLIAGFLLENYLNGRKKKKVGHEKTSCRRIEFVV